MNEQVLIQLAQERNLPLWKDTPVGKILITPDGFRVNGRAICVIATQPVAQCDYPLLRILWLNYCTEKLIRIVAEQLMSKCPICKELTGSFFCTCDLEELIAHLLETDSEYTIITSTGSVIAEGNAQEIRKWLSVWSFDEKFEIIRRDPSEFAVNVTEEFLLFILAFCPNCYIAAAHATQSEYFSLAKVHFRRCQNAVHSH